MITGNYVAVLILAVLTIGVLAFVVSAITEVTKGVGFLAKIPTDLEVIIISLILCVMTYFAYASITNSHILWYLVAGTIIGSFIVSLISMKGWKVTIDLVKRYIDTTAIKELGDIMNTTKKE